MNSPLEHYNEKSNTLDIKPDSDDKKVEIFAIESPVLEDPSDLVAPTDPVRPQNDTDVPLPEFKVHELASTSNDTEHYDGIELAAAIHKAGFSPLALGALRPKCERDMPGRGVSDYIRMIAEGGGQVVYCMKQQDGNYELGSWNPSGKPKRGCLGWRNEEYSPSWWMGKPLGLETEPKTLSPSSEHYNRMRNVGIRTGKGLLVLDIDRKDGKDGLQALLDRLGDSYADLFPPTFTVETPSGGYHLYYRTTAHLANTSSSLAEGVDTRGDGGLVVAPGSLSKSGRKYRVIVDLPVAILPLDTIELLRSLKPEWKDPGDREVDLADLDTISVNDRYARAERYLRKANLVAVQGKGGSDVTFKVARYLVKGFALPREKAMKLFKEWNKGCRPPWSEAELKHKMDDAERGTGLVGFMLTKGNPLKKPAPPPLASKGAAWEAKLEKDSDGYIISSVSNAEIILRNDESWKGKLRYNTLSGITELRDAFPGTTDLRPSPKWISPRDTIQVHIWLDRQWGIKVHRGLDEVISQLSILNRYHPVQEYLKSLRWDGTRRLDTWLTKYCGVDDSPYTRLVGRMWIISGVARAMQPGVKVDHMLIMEGSQGLAKGKVLRALAHEDAWFNDNLGKIGEVETKKQFLGKWIVEVAELDAFNRADMNAIKSAITTQYDNYRRSYAPDSEDHPRSCIFAASTNKEHYIDDPTGVRRWWPVKCKALLPNGEMDAPSLVLDHDQIWAEAYAEYENGALWYPTTAEEKALLAPEAEARQAYDEWDCTVALYVASKEKVTSKDILTGVLGFVERDIEQRQSKRVASILQKLGWIRSQQRINGVSVKCFIRGEKAEPRQEAEPPTRSVPDPLTEMN